MDEGIDRPFLVLDIPLYPPSPLMESLTDPPEAQPPSRILPQLLLSHPQNWNVQERILLSLFPEQGGGHVLPQSTREMVFVDEANSFHFHALGEPTPERNSEDRDRDILLPKEPLTPEQEQLHTPHFSPSVFFSALDEFRDEEESNRASTWRIGDALLYGEVVTSTQSMLER